MVGLVLIWQVSILLLSQRYFFLWLRKHIYDISKGAPYVCPVSELCARIELFSKIFLLSWTILNRVRHAQYMITMYRPSHSLYICSAEHAIHAPVWAVKKSLTKILDVKLILVKLFFSLFN